MREFTTRPQVCHTYACSSKLVFVGVCDPYRHARLFIKSQDVVAAIATWCVRCLVALLLFLHRSKTSSPYLSRGIRSRLPEHRRSMRFAPLTIHCRTLESIAMSDCASVASSRDSLPGAWLWSGAPARPTHDILYTATLERQRLLRSGPPVDVFAMLTADPPPCRFYLAAGSCCCDWLPEACETLGTAVYRC